MNAFHYHLLAARTRMDLPRAAAITYCALKLSGEAGETHETAMRPSTRTQQIRELGDCCWYVAWLADLLGVDALTLWTTYEEPAVFTFYAATERLSQAAHAVCEATGKIQHGKPESGIVPPLRATVGTIMACARVLGVPIADVWAENVRKLEARHPGQFSGDYAPET